MTFDTADVLAGLAEASAEGYATAKQVASMMGIKGSSPLIKSVRTELDRLVRQGRIETELDPSVGRRYKAIEEASGPAGIMAGMERRARAEEDGRLPEEEPEEESEEDESEDEPEPEPEPADDDEEEEHQRLRRRTLPTATHRVLKVLSDGQRRRMMDLKGYGISSTTLKPMREAKLVSADSEGYVITEAGRRMVEEIERDWPELAASRPDPIPAEEPAEAPKPEPEHVQKVEQLPELEEAQGYDGPDPLPDDPPMSEAENAVVEGVEAVTVYRLTLRTARGVRTVDVSDPYVIGKADATAFLVGMAARVRTVGGRVQVGHIVDDVWRDAA